MIELALSSFFALHRPISINNVMPGSISESDFNRIFKLDAQSKKEKFDDVLFTLGNAVHGLEDVTGDPMYDLDPYGNPASCVPYHPPPPPQPLADRLNEKKSKTASQRQPRKQTKPKRTKGGTWQTTIVVTEYTEANGKQIFETAASPMIRLPVNDIVDMEEPQSRSRGTVRHPFLDRMRVRQLKWLASRGKSMRPPTRKPRMLLISVKRQRKAKMKKHKLKKLRKRTRNLKRKLGQL